VSLPWLSTNWLAGDARQVDRKDARVGVIVRRNEALVPELRRSDRPKHPGSYIKNRRRRYTFFHRLVNDYA
jgi:hypothetical protein